jgi:hypothetical protein
MVFQLFELLPCSFDVGIISHPASLLPLREQKLRYFAVGIEKALVTFCRCLIFRHYKIEVVFEVLSCKLLSVFNVGQSGTGALFVVLLVLRQGL